MVVFVVIGVLVLVLIGLFWTPLIIRIDTDLNKYEVRFFGIAKAWLSVEEDELKAHVWVLGYHHESSPKFASAKKKERGRGRRKRKSASKRRLKNAFNAIRSFKIKTFKVSLDTDDYVVNAQLIPICWLLGLLRLNVSVNFSGDSYCRLEVRNNLWRLVSAFLYLKKY